MKKLLLVLLLIPSLSYGFGGPGGGFIDANTGLKIGDSSGTIINPATEDKQDDIIENQTDGTQKTQVVDSDGDPYIPDPYLTLCAGRKVKISEATYINKFGENPEIDTNTDPEDIWDAGGLWVPPTRANGAQIHNIVSTQAADTGTLVSNGTATNTSKSCTSLVDTAADFVSDGVQVYDTVLNDINYDHATVLAVTATTLTLELSVHCNEPYFTSSGFNSGDTYRIVTPASTGASITHWFGLDSNMQEQQEFVIMNGLNNVSTINSYWRIYRGHVDGAAGRTSNNVGNISATAATDTTVSAQINAANGQTGMAVYTVPKGKFACMTKIYADIIKPGAVTTTASLTLRETPIATVDGAGSRAKHFFGVVETGSSHYDHPFHPYRRTPENTDIWVRADAVSSNNTVVSAGFDLILVDN